MKSLAELGRSFPPGCGPRPRGCGPVAQGYFSAVPTVSPALHGSTHTHSIPGVCQVSYGLPGSHVALVLSKRVFCGPFHKSNTEKEGCFQEPEGLASVLLTHEQFLASRDSHQELIKANPKLFIWVRFLFTLLFKTKMLFL